MERPLARDLIIFHEVVADKYPRVGRGPLNEGRLLSIVERPFAGWGGRPVYTSIFEQAACLLEGIIRYHPFQDGNKRTALLAAEFFLWNNGHPIRIPDDAAGMLRGVATARADTGEEVERLIWRIAGQLEGMAAGPVPAA